MGKFLKSIKEVKKSAGNTLINGGIRCGTAVGTAFLLNGKLGEKIPAKLQDWRGEIMVGLGTAIDVFGANEKLRAAGQGLQVYGALESTVHLALKGDGTKMGFGVRNNATAKAPGGTSGLGAQPVDWKALADEAVAAEAADREMQGVQEEKEEEDLNGSFKQQRQAVAFD